VFKIATAFVIASVLSGCANINPAQSPCFSKGRIVCDFTPIDQLWGEPDAVHKN